MAFASSFRRIVIGSPSLAAAAAAAQSILHTPPPRLGSIRFNTTLTTPNLFVSGLNRLTTEEKLREAFSKFGQLVNAKVVVDKASQRSKGFGFVSYATIEEAEKARAEMNAKFLDGWVIFVDPAKPRQPRPPPVQEQKQTSDLGFRVNKTIGWCG